MAESVETVLVTVQSPVLVTVEKNSSVVVMHKEADYVTSPDIVNVLVDRDVGSIVVSGLLGPPGKDGLAEENVLYAKRIDFVTDDEIYRGEAEPGSLESSPVWRIRKVLIAADSDVSETWASGNTLFDKSWSLRGTYTYI